MDACLKCLDRFWRNDRGAAAIEYALIASLIGIAVASVAPDVGNALSALFGDDNSGIAGALKNANAEVSSS